MRRSSAMENLFLDAMKRILWCCCGCVSVSFYTFRCTCCGCLWINRDEFHPTVCCMTRTGAHVCWSLRSPLRNLEANEFDWLHCNAQIVLLLLPSHSLRCCEVIHRRRYTQRVAHLYIDSQVRLFCFLISSIMFLFDLPVSCSYPELITDHYCFQHLNKCNG